MRKVEVVLLCEDEQHKRFLLRLFVKLGFNRRQLRPVPYPAGAGSGEQWVRERYPTEVAAQRRRANHTSARLVAITDADLMTVDERVQTLHEALATACHPPREEGERIALFVPRRNIETWIHFFEAEGVIDEVTDFKPRYRDDAKKCRSAAVATASLYRSSTNDAPVLPSLVTACDELRRVVEP